ncbi:DUF3761 domain-containing protein [Streptomyces sp. DSM 15324]|nr:DUF3761 domain-containing protein [Streptomyces sp. DSM 15324]
MPGTRPGCARPTARIRGLRRRSCKDGTYSYSAHFRGTCSGHRGVKYWYR